MTNRICAAILAASAALGLTACTTDGYGYGGVGLGYYGSGYYGDPYWGWYDNYYYPGVGYYIYDRSGTRHRWSDGQRAYWEGRRGSRPARENWSGYRDRSPDAAQAWQQRREAWRAQGSGLTDAQRTERREAWRAQRQQQGQQGVTSGQGQRGGGWNRDRRRSGGRGD